MIMNKNTRRYLKDMQVFCMHITIQNKAIAIAATTAICASKSLMNLRISMPLHLLELP